MGRKLITELCDIEGCSEPRRILIKGGRSWRSALCRKHDLEREKDNRRGVIRRPRRKSIDQRSYTVVQVYALWGEGKDVGQLWYRGARVYGLTRYAERFVAVVAPCDQPVKLPKNARLTTGKI